MKAKWLGILGLVFFALALADTAYATSAKSALDIVYSARYYKPGMHPSHYKIWRTDSIGSRRFQVTTGNTEDHSPVWLTEGKILFVREAAKRRTLCVVNEDGGHVTELATLPEGYKFIESVAPNRRMVVYLVRDSDWKLVLFDVKTRQERPLGIGLETAWSQDSRRLYITTWDHSVAAAYIFDVVTGNRVPLTGDFGAATWLNDHTLVAELSAQDKEQTRLIILSADGTKEREVLLPFTWDDEDEEVSPFADNLFAIPGVDDAVLYGRHAGSSAGSAQRFYRVSLKGGQPTVVVRGRNLSWSSDDWLFVTSDGRSLARLDKKKEVWVSPLAVVSLKNGRVYTIVHGLVHVGGFDWRPRELITSSSLDPKEILRNTLIKDNIYSWSRNGTCLGFFQEETKMSLVTIAVRSECDRQDDWAPLVDRFKVNATTGQIFWVEPTDLSIIPYDEWRLKKE